MKKTFVTIVPHIENLELRKDTGQLPYQFHKVLGYDSTLVSYYYSLKGGRKAGPIVIPPIDIAQVHKDYPYLASEVNGLKVKFLSHLGRARFYEKAIRLYLKKNAKRIAILNLFHFSSESIFYTLYYKWKNPNGKVYLKLDIDIDFYNSKKKFIHLGNRLPFIGRFIESVILKLFFKAVTLITAESDAGFAYFKDRFNPPPQKLVLIRNGVDEDQILKIVDKIKTFEEKENIILTVGRIGNPQKNTPFLLDAITKIDLTDWKVYLVGPIEEGFQSKIDEYFALNPQLKNKVIFTGAAKDPQELYAYYNIAKIFCMPSLAEGFPLVICEALFFGCYPVLSNRIYGAHDLFPKDQGAFFSLETKDELPKMLDELMKKEEMLHQAYTKNIGLAKEEFTWKKNILKISKALEFDQK